MPFRLGRPAAFVLSILALASLMSAASAPSPIYPLYQQRWGFSAFTLTIIFAIYVVALLATLLVVGSLSDHLGRRPMVISALLLIALSMLLFVHADGVGGLLAARVMQGVATGVGTGTLSAAIVDSQPHPRLGAAFTGAAPTSGIALGAVLAGALVQYAPAPRQTVYWVLFGLYLVLAVLALGLPDHRDEHRSSRSHVLRTLRPGVGIPAVARSTFYPAVPSMCGTWALGGLYLSLGSSVLGSLLGVTNHLVVGIVLGVFFGGGAVGAVLSHQVPQPWRSALGFVALGAGVLLTVGATVVPSLPAYVVGSAVAGLGFGSTFAIVLAQLSAVAPPRERGQLFTTTFVVSYVAFSIPAVLAGLAVQAWGLKQVVVGYGLLDVLVVLLAAVLAARRRDPRPATVSAAPTVAAGRSGGVGDGT